MAVPSWVTRDPHADVDTDINNDMAVGLTNSCRATEIWSIGGGRIMEHGALGLELCTGSSRIIAAWSMIMATEIWSIGGGRIMEHGAL
nr:hypothetical protein [Tanacetum cinerariifolium]